MAAPRRVARLLFLMAAALGAGVASAYHVQDGDLQPLLVGDDPLVATPNAPGHTGHTLIAEFVVGPSCRGATCPSGDTRPPSGFEVRAQTLSRANPLPGQGRGEECRFGGPAAAPITNFRRFPTARILQG